MGSGGGICGGSSGDGGGGSGGDGGGGGGGSSGGWGDCIFSNQKIIKGTRKLMH